MFAANATDALNLAIQGMTRPGDHVVSTRLEHNSVLRPLWHLREAGRIAFDLVPFDGQGLVDPAAVARAIRPETRLVVVSHASSVLGTVQPVAEIAAACAARGVPLLLDAAQSAGHVPVRLSDWQVSAIAFTGHKALLGPSGSGGLVVAPDTEIAPTRFGGTGVDSASLVHTPTYPHRLEAGTLNLLGIIGLNEGLAFVEAEDMAAAQEREIALARRLREGLAALPGVAVYSPVPRDGDVPIVTCNVTAIAPSDVGAILDGDYGIAVRTGLQCAPLVHHDLRHRRAGRRALQPGPLHERRRRRLGAAGDDRHRAERRSAVRVRGGPDRSLGSRGLAPSARPACSRRGERGEGRCAPATLRPRPGASYFFSFIASASALPAVVVTLPAANTPVGLRHSASHCAPRTSGPLHRLSQARAPDGE